MNTVHPCLIQIITMATSAYDFSQQEKGRRVVWLLRHTVNDASLTSVETPVLAPSKTTILEGQHFLQTQRGMIEHGQQTPTEHDDSAMHYSNKFAAG